MYSNRTTPAIATLFMLLSSALAVAQLGASGTLTGTVVDQTGAVIPGAQVKISNPISHYQNSTQAGSAGQFSFQNVPFNHYHIKVDAKGFSTLERDVDVRTAVPVAVKLEMPLAASSTEIKVEATSEDVVENDATAHMDLDSELMSKLPIANATSAISAVIATSTPGVVNDSNGMFHPQGEHADTSYVIDNQPISDQKSKQFSNQISSNVVQSMELVTGVAPAEFGDKASLVVRTTTKSGLGLDKPHGSLNLGYGSFGTPSGDLSLSVGNKSWGNFVAIDGMDSGRFLDSPEFRPLHDHGNAENFFDRVDYLFKNNDTLHLDLSLARSWFQIPNQYDQEAVGQDQRQQIRSFNFAPGYTHLFNNSTLLSANAWVRQDRVSYYPSSDVFQDRPATLAQTRRLTNTGFKVDVAYSKGVHNVKGGFIFSYTPLSEFFQTGITDPLANAVCVDATGVPVIAQGVNAPAGCAAAGYVPNPGFSSGLSPYDLTRGGQLFTFRGSADIKQEGAYVQDSISAKNFNFQLGLRADNYDGLSSRTGIQPRTGLSYQVRKTGTVLRASYGRIFLTPYNENLILSSSTGVGGLEGAAGGLATPLIPARRNHFETGFQQAIDGFVVIDASYFWKFTQDDFDFDVFLNTPLAFPIQWRKSKIDGFSIRVSMPERYGLSAYSVMGHTRARFFEPEVGGIIFNSPVGDEPVFRIDHDQAFQQNTHLHYQPTKRSPWFAFTWSYESGEVAGTVPDFATLLTLTGDQQQQAGLFCGTTFATVSSPIRSCSANIGSTRLSIPATGTSDADKNPSRVAPRNTFDASIGWDNIFHRDRYKWNLSFTVVNLTNEDALYNLLSTFSGTHFVTPRSYKAEIGMDF